MPWSLYPDVTWNIVKTDYVMKKGLCMFLVTIFLTKGFFFVVDRQSCKIIVRNND